MKGNSRSRAIRTEKAREAILKPRPKRRAVGKVRYVPKGV